MSIWTDEEITRLRELYSAGSSVTQIGIELGKTRGSVSGKIDRLGIRVARVIPTVEETKPRIDRRKTNGNLESLAERLQARKWIAQRAAVAAPTALPPEAPQEAVGFMDLREFHCRWVLDTKGDDGLAMYCGCRKMPGLSYCKEHSERIYADRDTWFREQREAMRRVMGSQRASA